MQRHQILRDLSSEHHTGLVIARRARRASEQESLAQSAAWQDLKTIFHGELDAHFQREERGILPALQQAGEVALVERTLHEHQQMRDFIDADQPDNLAAFAELLTAHIRFEELQLFETAQAVLSQEQLALLRQRDSE